jgi:hypothetical protein
MGGKGTELVGIGGSIAGALDNGSTADFRIRACEGGRVGIGGFSICKHRVLGSFRFIGIILRYTGSRCTSVHRLPIINSSDSLRVCSQSCSQSKVGSRCEHETKKLK